MAESQAFTVLADTLYDDPSQLSQALRQRAGNDRPLHFTTSTESNHSGITASALSPSRQLNHAHVPQQPPVVLAQLDRALSSRRVATAKYVKPALHIQRSAPTSTGFVVEKGGANKMHHSFNGMDAPGDTQPDSQMHKQWTSGVFPTVEANNRGPGPISLFIEHVEEEEDDDLPTDEVDASQSSQQRNNLTVTSPTVIDIDDRAPAEQHSLALTSPLKFETPALAGRKRDNAGQILSSEARTNTTPGTVASASAFFPTAFGNGAIAGGPLMSLTQAWQNTQAPTSPAVGGASEDVVFTRPSPNFTNARHSSPIPAYSSPIKAMRPETPRSDPVVRSSSEPRAEYVTMKQSQEKRKLSTGDARVVAVEQDSWEELSVKLKRKKAKEQFHQRAARSLSNISAPTPLVPQSGRRRTVNAKYSSPVRSKAPRRMAHADLHEEEEDDSMDELSQPIPRVRHDAEDSPDELSQDVPSTARTTANYNSNDNRVQVPKTSSHPYRTPSGQAAHNSSQQATPSSQLQRESQLRAPGSQPLLRGTFRPPSSKDSVAIMDSQPDATADYHTMPQPKSLRFPSSPSTNQYSINQTTMAARTGYTSQVISSSMPPMPPKSSPTELDEALNGEKTVDEEERVPSSPPILTDNELVTHEEEIEYDEHAYDEYAEGIENQENAGPLAVDDDVLMDEDEDLPVVKQVSGKEAAEGKQVDAADDDELDLVQPLKVDLGTDQEIPESLAYEQPAKRTYQDQGISKVDDHAEVPRMQRQNTVPETDALDETQPSFSPDNVRHESADSAEFVDHTNSTEPFQTAQEEQSRSQSTRPVPLSSREEGSDAIHVDDRIRSINDIHNLPATQQSTGEDEIEMPRLSGLDPNEEDVLLLRSSPAPPSAKRRKVTYTAKRKVFRSPVKSLTDSEPLSDPPPSPPSQHVEQALEGTPPRASAREGEEQGALAAVAAREDAQALYSRPATRKSAGLPRSSKVQAQRKGALKPITRELLQSLSSPNKSPSKPRGSFTSRASTPLSPTKRRADTGNAQPGVGMTEPDNEADEPAGPTPQAANLEAFVEVMSTRDETPPGNVLVPNRVFASWPGSHYYPATCIGRSTSRLLQIRFDDGNMTTLDSVHVRALNLRTGDQVKVDETGMKKNTYVVVGFKDKIDDLDGEEFPSTDQLGYATIVLEEKRRDSLPVAEPVLAAEHISVPMASIYLTTGLWARLRDRSFNFSPPTSPNKAASRIGTPIIEPLTTPSFTRRGITAPSLLKDATARAASVASTARSGTSVFSHMAFVLTSTAADVDKEAIAKLIKTNGGQVLEHGFHELFDYESAEVTSSQSRRRSISIDENSVGLSLKHSHKDLGFVALISDSHSRSTKYIQALALNVPCLHLRWIQDSLAAARALSFAKYLLPAGVSKYLDPSGVLRSRTMSIYDPAGDDISFAQTIQDRDLLLHDQTVLLVTGKSKKEIERRQPFIFLTHALGSANVGRCADLAAAARMLTEAQWDWVYVDNGERGVADAAAELFGRTNNGKSGGGPTRVKKGKKRKADESEEREELVVRGDFAGRKVRITCAEFVIQSLILGALVEE